MTQNKAAEIALFDKFAKRGYEFSSFSRKAIGKAYNDIGLINVEGLSILECGCATGEFGKVFANMGADVFGVDISPKMIKLNKEKSAPKRYSCFSGDLEQPNLFHFNSFDIIFCARFLHHFPERTFLYQAFKKWLEYQGKIVILECNPDNVIDKITSTIFSHTENEKHLTRTGLLKELELNGFKTVRSGYINLTMLGKYIYPIVKLLFNKPENHSNHFYAIVEKK